MKRCYRHPQGTLSSAAFVNIVMTTFLWGGENPVLLSPPKTYGQLKASLGPSVSCVSIYPKKYEERDLTCVRDTTDID